MMLLLKNLLFTFVVPGTVGVYVPLLLSQHRIGALGASFAAALLLFIVGGAIYSWCVFDFATFGRGTPFPLDAPVKLVRRGLYRYTRNPMYVGVLSLIFGWAFLFHSEPIAIYGVIVAMCFYTFVVFGEEPALRRRFGADYEQYCLEVPRFLIR
jgi:protein-S-isoprenylcysteine O-methyltransferase Ste14